MIPLSSIPRRKDSQTAKDARAMLAEGARSPSPDPLPPPGTEVAVAWVGERVAVVRLPREERPSPRWVVPIDGILVDPQTWRWVALAPQPRRIAEARRRGGELRARALQAKLGAAGGDAL